MAMTMVMTAGPADEGPITMNIFSADSRIAKADSARGRQSMNVETVATSPLLSSDRKWAIRFNANGLTTIVLGMRDFGNGYLSAYFARLVVARLGIPLGRIRLYYSATHPAVLQKARPCPDLSSGCNFGPVAAAAAGVIERMCDRVIERRRVTSTAVAGVASFKAGFDQCAGRFSEDQGGNVLEIAKATQGKSPLEIESARRLREVTNSVTTEIPAPSA
jgi:hypothetical protein